MNKVPGRGPLNAEILCLGEEPGPDEFTAGKPFVGASGHILVNQILSPNMILEKDVRFDNVIQHKTQGKNPTDLEIYDNLFDLRKRIQELPNLKVIIAIGGVALKALSLFQRTEITKYRGYFFQSRLTGHWTLPILHPSFIMQGAQSALHVNITDVRKVRDENFLPPSREHRICRNEEAFLPLTFLETYNGSVVIDIETTIPCIGFSIDPNQSDTVIYDPNDPDSLIKRETKRLLDAVFANKSLKWITQNGLFDRKVLTDFFKIDPKTWRIYFDTMYAQQMLYPGIPEILKPNSLQFLTSFYTNEPFYKDEGRKWRRGIDDEDQFFRYNGKDCCITFEIYLQQLKDLIEINQQRYFFDILMPTTEVLFRMWQNGVSISKENLQLFIEDIKRNSAIAELKFIKETKSTPPNVRSPIEMEQYLLSSGVKERDITRSEKTGKVKTNEDYIRSLFAKTQKPELLFLMDIHKYKTLKSNFTSFHLDESSRYHANFKFGPQGGRLASTGDEGPQLQNLPSQVICRSIIAAGQGKVLVKADLEQADVRVVAYIAPEPTLISIFESSDPDIHSQIAALVTGRDRESFTKKDPIRYVFKKIVHATNYGMGPRRFVSVLREEGIFIKESEAKRYQENYLNRFSGIKIWHMNVQNQVKKNRYVTDLFGRRHMLLGAFDDKTFGAAYSRVPQGTVAGIMYTGMIKLQGMIDTFPQMSNTLIILQVHDEIVLECKEEFKDWTIAAVRECFSVPLTAHNRIFTIPLEISVGETWGTMEKV